MKTIALTGSIGMGKSTTAALFAERQIPVYDADREVHKLYASGGAGAHLLKPLLDDEQYFDVIDADQSINRIVLRNYIRQIPDFLNKIERVIHPILEKKRAAFLENNKDLAFVVLDIPLLFENALHDNFDYVVVVTAPKDVQRARVLSRPGMTPAAFEGILARQVPDVEKRSRADFVIETHHGIDHAREQVVGILKMLEGLNG